MFQIEQEPGQGYDPRDPDFLQSNRMGRLHDRQKAFLTLNAVGRASFRQTRFGIWTPAFRMGGSLFFYLLASMCILAVTIPFIGRMPWPSWLKITIGPLLWGLPTGLWLLSFYRHRAASAALQADLAAGQVQRTTAHLEFTNRWQVTSPQGRLQLPWFISPSAMAPGQTYTVYYLPNSRYVIGLETDSIAARGASSQDEEEAVYMQTLQTVFKFAPHALPANRRGHLHPLQKQQMLANIKRQALLLFLVLLGLIVGAIETGQGAFLLLAGVLFAFWLFSAISKAQAIRKGTVLSAQGEGRKYTREHTTYDEDGASSAIAYYIQIGLKEFEVSKREYEVFFTRPGLSRLLPRAGYTDQP
jgi:hypothetical protein